MADEALLSLADVLKELGWTENKDRSAMNRYLSIPIIDELLGATGNGRGTKYPADRLWLFRDLAKAHGRGEISPKTAEPFLRQRIAAGPAIDGIFEEHPDTRISEYTPNTDNGTGPAAGSGAVALSPIVAGQVEQIGRTFADTFAEIAIQRFKTSGILPPVEDRLIDQTEAAQLLGLTDKPHLVGRRVPPVLRGQWSRNMVLQHIADLVSKAQEKAQAKAAKRQKKHGPQYRD